jgi:dihydroflavonol-4-reductase
MDGCDIPDLPIGCAENYANPETSEPARTVFLSGATGTLGSDVLRVLLERSFRVRILVKDASKLSPLFLMRWRELPGSIDGVIEGDLSMKDGETKGRIFSGMRDCKIVYHCAGIPEGWQINEEIWDAVNRNGTEIMLNAAIAAKVKTFVHISAIDTYSVPNGDVELREESSKHDPTDPNLTPYQRSKVNAEIAVDLARSRRTGMHVVTLNAANFYGPTSRSCWVNHFILSILCGKSLQVNK